MQNTSIAGATNLLVNCAGARAGERLLILSESPHHGYYRACASRAVETAAADLDLRTERIEVAFFPEWPELPADVERRMQDADITVFLARIGDQLRFADMPAGRRMVLSFALDGHMLGSPFGVGPYQAFVELKSAVDRCLAAASTIRLTCPAGTDVSGSPEIDLDVNGDTTVTRFPLSVFTPVPAASFTGTVALPGFLTGTGCMYYEPYTVHLPKSVHARLEAGRLAGFDGPPEGVRIAEAHYDKIATRYGIDRDFVHSWHAGIHPGCTFDGLASDSYERWSGSAFGNPRLLHFHTCGAYAPGEVSWNVVDPTIEADGLKLWENGVFRADRLAEGPDILARYPDVAAIFDHPSRQIGL